MLKRCIAWSMTGRLRERWLKSRIRIPGRWRTSGSHPPRRSLPREPGIILRLPAPRATTETLVGLVGLRVDAAKRTGRLGYWVGRAYWGHGVATEAAGRMISWGFANLPLDHVIAEVTEGNDASCAVLRRIGFRRDRDGRAAFADHWRGAHRDGVRGDPR